MNLYILCAILPFLLVVAEDGSDSEFRSVEGKRVREKQARGRLGLRDGGDVFLDTDSERQADIGFRKYKRLKKIDSVEDYAEGDLDPALLAQSSKNFEDMVGKWEILLDRSESADDILAALGIPFIKRSILRRSSTQVKIEDIATSEDGRDFTHVWSYLPMNSVKEGQIFVDNEPFSVVDKDTGVWRATAMISDGRLLQKRVSRTGIMYDVRATFAEDPEGIVTQKPLHLFKWTFIEKSGTRHVAHRWFSRVDDVATTHIE